jgi:putative membrane protein
MEASWLIAWSVISTLLLQISHWNFLTIPIPILTITGSALAISLAFKNQQCYARFNDALVLADQLVTSSMILANRLVSALGKIDASSSVPEIRRIFYRHFAWLTALRFRLRDTKAWENTLDPGNITFLARIPSPESQSVLEDEIREYLSDAEMQKLLKFPDNMETQILRWQYEEISNLHTINVINDPIFIFISSAIDDLLRLQGGLERIKNYPYSRNYYSITIILVMIFVAMVPFGLFSYAQDLGRPFGIEGWTAWLNVPFSVVVGWVFVSLEKVGENSSNPFEGGSNDVPISFIARKIEIEMRSMLGEDIELKPVEAKHDILF